jgi:monoamine oxidase
VTRLWRASRGAGVEVGGDGEATFEADVVVLALPFPALRNVNIEGAGFEGERLGAIRTLGMGRNTKLLFGLNRPLAEVDGWKGVAASDIGGEDVFIWDSTADQPGSSAILTVFTAEPIFEPEEPHGPAGPAAVKAGREIVESLVPGISDALEGPVWLDSWCDNPWIGGSYAALLAGQVTRWNGLIAEPDGPFYFCGEHTARYWQGYLEGAVESGERAAAEAIAQVMR